MKRFILWIFGVIKAWLARGKTPPQSAETKQKISLTVVGDYNDIIVTIKHNSKN